MAGATHHRCGGKATVGPAGLACPGFDAPSTVAVERRAARVIVLCGCARTIDAPDPNARMEMQNPVPPTADTALP
ncbi:hypothetical protein JCM2811A_10990 [Methylorubrum rhodinum]